MIRSLLNITLATFGAFLLALEQELDDVEVEDWAIELDPDELYEVCPCDGEGCTECWDTGLRVHGCD